MGATYVREERDGRSDAGTWRWGRGLEDGRRSGFLSVLLFVFLRYFLGAFIISSGQGGGRRRPQRAARRQ